jgi:hypothetical protein
MFSRKIFLASVCLLVVLGTLKVFSPSARNQNPIGAKRWEDPTTLRARAKKEKAKGQTKVTFPGPLMEYPEGVDLDTALSKTSVLVVELISKTSRVLDSHTIGTFYRAKVLETLTPSGSAGCFTPADADFPPELGPINADEIVIVGNGGTAVIEGVEVTVEEELGGLIPGRRYLLFSSPSASGKFAVLNLGPQGAFQVKANGDLEPLTVKLYKLQRELRQEHGNSLSRLKAHLTQRVGTPH